MGIDVYRKLIDELVENHRDLYGYHSDWLSATEMKDFQSLIGNCRRLHKKMIIHYNHDKPTNVYVVNSWLLVYRVYYRDDLGDTIAGLFTRMAPKVAPLAK